MPRFLAITSRGLLSPLTSEIQSLNVKRVRQKPDAVEFEGSWADLYRVHLRSRLATRILMPVSDFVAYNQDELYFGVLRKHDFTKYILPSQTLRVEAHVREHKNLTDQRFVAMKVKDALVDQFRDKFNERPSVGDEEHADLRVVVRIVGNDVSLALDLTGESLSYRGYRKFVGEAPLREHVAAGLVRLSSWQAPQALVDPFCGSGTILIEAALDLHGYLATRRRRVFAFEKLRGFQSEVYSALKKEDTRRAPPAKPILFGYDRDASVLEKARSNARAAGVENFILFQQRDVQNLKAPAGFESGILLTNPPYGERLEDTELAKQTMSVFSKTLKTEFKGWDAWILNGNPEAIKGLKLKSKLKIPVWNAQIECRLLHYPIT
jgi:putative N6-adenine-specific DNA methylase